MKESKQNMVRDNLIGQRTEFIYIWRCQHLTPKIQEAVLFILGFLQHRSWTGFTSDDVDPAVLVPMGKGMVWRLYIYIRFFGLALNYEYAA